MNRHIYFLYQCYFKGVKLRQSWWQRLKGRLTNSYEITIIPPYYEKCSMMVNGIYTVELEVYETTKKSIVLSPGMTRWKV